MTVANPPVVNQGDYVPADRGLLAWTYDPALAVGSGNLTSGQIAGGRIKHPGGSITGVTLGLITPMVGGVAGQNFVGIFDPVTSVLLAQSGDATGPFSPGGAQQIFVPLSVPTFLPAGQYDIGMLVNFATLAPAPSRLNSTTDMQAAGGPPGTTPRAFTSGAGLTALPAVMGAKALSSLIWWLAFY